MFKGDIFDKFNNIFKNFDDNFKRFDTDTPEEFMKGEYTKTTEQGTDENGKYTLETFISKDGNWRNEISDDGYRFKLTIDDIYSEYYKKARPIHLEKLITHDLIFKLTPELKKYFVIFKEYTGGNVFAEYDNRKTIVLYINFKYYFEHGKEQLTPITNYSKEQILLTEIMSVYQARFRFAKDIGIEKATERIRRRIEESRIQREQSLSKNDLLHARSLERDIQNLEDNFDQLVYLEYTTQLGEIEARDVAERIHLTEAERRKIFPLSSSDIPEDEIKVTFKEGSKIQPNKNITMENAGEITKELPDNIYWALDEISKKELTDTDFPTIKQPDESFFLDGIDNDFVIEKSDTDANKKLIWNYFDKNNVIYITNEGMMGIGKEREKFPNRYLIYVVPKSKSFKPHVWVEGGLFIAKEDAEAQAKQTRKMKDMYDAVEVVSITDKKAFPFNEIYNEIYRNKESLNKRLMDAYELMASMADKYFKGLDPRYGKHNGTDVDDYTDIMQELFDVAGIVIDYKNGGSAGEKNIKSIVKVDNDDRIEYDVYVNDIIQGSILFGKNEKPEYKYFASRGKGAKLFNSKFFDSMLKAENYIYSKTKDVHALTGKSVMGLMGYNNGGSSYASGGEIIKGKSMTFGELKKKLEPLKDGSTHFYYNKTNKVGGQPKWILVRIASIKNNEIELWDDVNKKIYSLYDYQFNNYSDPYLKFTSQMHNGGGAGEDFIKAKSDEFKNIYNIIKTPLKKYQDLTDEMVDKKLWDEKTRSDAGKFRANMDANDYWFKSRLNKMIDGGGAGAAYYIFEGVDHLNQKPLYQVLGRENDYVGEWHVDKKDAEKELDELNKKSTGSSADDITTIIISSSAPLSTALQALTGNSWSTQNFEGDSEDFTEIATGRKFKSYTLEKAKEQGITGIMIPSEGAIIDFYLKADEQGAHKTAMEYINNNLLTPELVDDLLQGYATAMPYEEKYKLLVSLNKLPEAECGGMMRTDSYRNAGDVSKDSTEYLIDQKLQPLIDEARQQIFVPEYRNKYSDYVVLGIIVSKYCRWGFENIQEVCVKAMEDSNFDDVAKMLKKLERGGKAYHEAGEISEEPEIVNGYKIKYNNFWGMYQVSHPEIGADIAEFKKKEDAINYSKNG